MTNGSIPSFGAKIIVTPYLNEALNQVIYPSVDRISLSEKAEFTTALQLIANDDRFDTFEIRGKKGSEIKPGHSRQSEILIDKQVIGMPRAKVGKIFDAEQCVKNVIEFARNIYNGGNLIEDPLINDSINIEKKQSRIGNYIHDTVLKLTNTHPFSILDMHRENLKNLSEIEQRNEWWDA